MRTQRIRCRLLLAVYPLSTHSLHAVCCLLFDPQRSLLSAPHFLVCPAVCSLLSAPQYSLLLAACCLPRRYVEIGFSSYGRLEGAAVRTYLLERSRVVHVAPNERTFHAFYQVCVCVCVCGLVRA